MPAKKKDVANLHPAKRRKSGIPVTLRIALKGSVFQQTVTRKDSTVAEWYSITQSESNCNKYHVGDMVVVQLENGKQELAVIAEFRGPYVSLVWVYETKNTKEREETVGSEIASTCDLILSIYSDVAPLSAIISTHRKGVLCKDYVLALVPSQVIAIPKDRINCFMRGLVEKIRARELFKGSTTSLNSLSSAQPERNSSSSSSVPEQDENGESANSRHQDIQSPASVGHFDASASGPADSTPATIRYWDQNPVTPTESSLSSTIPLALQTSSSSKQDASEGSNDQDYQSSDSTQSHNRTASESSIAPRSASFPGSPLPARTVDGSMESEDQQRSLNFLKQGYNQTTQSVLSALNELQKSAEAEEEQLPPHLKDGLISFLGSFGSSLPFFYPQYLWDAGQVEDFSMPKGKHLLVTTLRLFHELSSRKNHRMPKYVLIKNLEQSSAIECNWKQTLLKFLDEHPETELEIQDVTDGQKLTFERKASEVHSRLCHAIPRTSILRKCRNAQDKIPWNLLNIHGGYLNTVGLRATEGIGRFGCLANLCV